MSQFKYTHTRLLVSNFRSCFEFYRDILGLKPTFGKEDGRYANFEAGDVSIALFDKQEMSQAVGSANKPSRSESQDGACLVFEVDDVDRVYRELDARGVPIVMGPIDHQDWGIRTAHLRDPDGNLIEINTNLRPS